MPCRNIRSDASNLPSLSLPPGAVADGDATHEYDVTGDPPAIEPVEHEIRLDFMAGGPIRHGHLLTEYNSWGSGPDDQDPWRKHGLSKPRGLKYAEGTCRRRLDEEALYYDLYDDDRALAGVPAFLAHRLRQCRTAERPEEALRAERTRRENWYETLIPWLNLYQVLKRSSYGTLVADVVGPTYDAGTLTTENEFVGMVVLGDEDPESEEYAREHELSAEYVVKESELSCAEHESAPSPSEYGIELPAPLLIGRYASGSRYPFLPWSDGLVCSCPYKHDQPWRVLCKHELLAAIVAGDMDTIFLPVTDGLSVPHRARRFVSPDIASTHTPRVPSKGQP